MILLTGGEKYKLLYIQGGTVEITWKKKFEKDMFHGIYDNP